MTFLIGNFVSHIIKKIRPKIVKIVSYMRDTTVYVKGLKEEHNKHTSIKDSNVNFSTSLCWFAARSGCKEVIESDKEKITHLHSWPKNY